MTSLAERLAQIKPFGQLTEAERTALARDTQEVHFPADALVFAAGDVPPGLFLVEKGEVDIFSAAGDVVSHRIPGDSLSERAVLRGRGLHTRCGVDHAQPAYQLASGYGRPDARRDCHGP